MDLTKLEQPIDCPRDALPFFSQVADSRSYFFLYDTSLLRQFRVVSWSLNHGGQVNRFVFDSGAVRVSLPPHLQVEVERRKAGGLSLFDAVADYMFGTAAGLIANAIQARDEIGPVKQELIAVQRTEFDVLLAAWEKFLSQWKPDQIPRTLQDACTRVVVCKEWIQPVDIVIRYNGIRPDFSTCMERLAKLSGLTPVVRERI